MSSYLIDVYNLNNPKGDGDIFYFDIPWDPWENNLQSFVMFLTFFMILYMHCIHWCLAVLIQILHMKHENNCRGSCTSFILRSPKWWLFFF